MKRDRSFILLSLAAVGGVAAYAWTKPEDERAPPPRRSSSEAHVRARVMDDLPADATVVPASSSVLSAFPVARATVRRAVERGARDEWVGATVEGEGAERVARALHRDLPHFEPSATEDADEAGVYVRYDGRLVLLSAVGVALIDPTRQGLD
jgi:hypothetical protein